MVAKETIWMGKAVAILTGTLIDSRHELVRKFPDKFEKAPKEAA